MIPSHESGASCTDIEKGLPFGMAGESQINRGGDKLRREVRIGGIQAKSGKQGFQLARATREMANVK